MGGNMIELKIFKIRIKIKQGEFVVIHGEPTFGKSSTLRDLNREQPDKVCFLIRDDVTSGQHRLDILKATISDPDVYLVDEPTGHDLDREDRMNILRMLKILNEPRYDKKGNLHEGKTIIMVTHDRAAIELGTRVIQLFKDKTFIDHGKGLHHLIADVFNPEEVS